MQEQQDLSEEWQERARKELGERPEWLSRDIATFRQMIQEEGGITCPTDDAFLLRYLRARKFDVDRALNSIKKYCQLLESQSHLKHLLVPSALLDKIADQKIITILKDRDPLGRRVAVIQLGKWDPQQLSADEFFCFSLMILEMITKEAETQIAGSVSIWDLENLSWRHLKFFTPGALGRDTSLLQDCIPLRTEAMHVINSGFFAIGYALVRPFLSKKIRSRVHFHSDVKKIHKYVPASILPEELGGDLPPLDISENLSALRSNEDYFKEIQKMGYKKPQKQ